jgi:SAM-dependent methyltransferase
MEQGGARRAHPRELNARVASARAMHQEAVSPNHIIEIGYAFRKSKALLSALELDLFTELADQPLPIEAVIERTGLHSRGARDFLDALVALELLDRDAEGRYANRPATAYYLDRRKQTYIGGPLQRINARLYGSWGLLTQALRTGMPQTPLGNGYAEFYQDPVEFDRFLSAMSGGSLLAAKSLAAKFPWHKYRTVIDIGTAQGCVPAELASAHPHLTGGGFDLPQIAPAFAKYVGERNLSGRLKFFPGNFLKDALPETDVLIFGRILHNWNLATKKLLLQKAHRALSPGGALIVYDALIDDTRRGPAHSLLASLNMLIETPGGFEYTEAECRDWMREAGFRELHVEVLSGLHKALIGIR